MRGIVADFSASLKRALRTKQAMSLWGQGGDRRGWEGLETRIWHLMSACVLTVPSECWQRTNSVLPTVGDGSLLSDGDTRLTAVICPRSYGPCTGTQASAPQPNPVPSYSGACVFREMGSRKAPGGTWRSARLSSLGELLPEEGASEAHICVPAAEDFPNNR